MNIKADMQAGFCDNQPLLHGQCIQSFGVLFVLDFGFKILQVSANVDSILSCPAKQFIGENFSSYLEPGELELLKFTLDSGKASNLNGLILTLNSPGISRQFAATFNLTEHYWIVELEIRGEDKQDIYELLARNRLAKLSLELKRYLTLAELYEGTAAELKEILGVDKVMIYRFDESWRGTVLAEAKAAGMESYLDLRFPDTDVPEPVRRLYERNPFRMIADVAASEAQMVPALNPLTDKPADMSGCILRGVAPVHVEYLKNMQVTASISVAVIQEGVLWGLISMHNLTPKVFNPAVREALKLFSECFTARLFYLESREEHDHIAGIADFRGSLADSGMRGEFPFGVLSKELHSISHLLNAQGAAFLLDGNWFKWGHVPDQENLVRLTAWLQANSGQKVFCTQFLSGLYADGSAIKDISSGLLAVSISGQFEDLVMWFRPEEEQTVKWGGDPGNTVTFDAEKKTYHPRRSFEIWKESIHLNSAPWRAVEKKAAKEICQMLTDALQSYRSARLKTLSGLLPICSYCKKIRDEHDSWRVLEEYIQKRTTAEFSHGVCPECYKKVMQDALSNVNAGK